MRAADRERRRDDGTVEEHEGHRGHGGGRGRGGRGGFRGEIRSGQGRVLGILALQSPLPQKNLAYMLGVRPQSLSELIAKLETAGLVTRERDENDRRSFLIELTETGREAASEIDACTGEDPFDVLTDEERETWCTLTTKVTDALEEKYPEIGERARHFREAGREFGRGPGFGPGVGPGPHSRPHGGPHGGPNCEPEDGPGRGRRGHSRPDGERPHRRDEAEFREYRETREYRSGHGHRGRRGHRDGRGHEGFGGFRGFGRGMTPGFA
jgi:DNA-binding MarR family transcriptional regulator